MIFQEYYDTRGIDTFTNPLNQSSDGKLIHCVNFVSEPFGGKTKRTGYSAFLGTPDTAQINSLLVFPNIGNDPTRFNLYRASGSALYYSLQGTGAWTLAANGTIGNGAHFGAAILDNVFIGGDGQGSTRHTTDGTTFVNTPLAPIAEHFEQYQNRIYAAGTSSSLFYSVTNDGTNWNTTGTADSSSFEIPGEGKLGKIFKAADRLIATKTSGAILRWDGYSLVDMATRYGPSSPYSIGEVEDYRFFINQYGNFGFDGVRPMILSNAIQRQFYNNANTGIAGTVFSTAPGVAHIYDYFVSVGMITDDFTDRTISNAIIKYDYIKNEYLNFSFAHKPTSWLSYNDANGKRQLIFGDGNGQVYQMDNTVFTDNGTAINAEMVFVYHAKVPKFDKKWNYWRGYFNPGCEARVQIASTNVYTYENLTWKDIGDVKNGVAEYRFPAESRSKFLFVRIYDSSKTSRTVYYGADISADIYEVS